MRLTLVALLLHASLWAQAPISYGVAFDPSTLSTFTVTVRVPGDVAGDVRLLLPTWSPKSWRQVSWADRIQSTKAADASGARVDITRDGDVLVVKGRAPVTVTIEIGQTVQALGVREYFTAHGALVDGARTFPLVRGAGDRPCELTVSVPDKWDVASPLEPLEAKRSWIAADYRTLVDAPILAGSLMRWSFKHSGASHDVVLDRQGVAGRPSLDPLMKALKKTVAAHEEMVGKAPYKRWLMLLVEGTRGRRPHKNALTIGVAAGALGGDTTDFLISASTALAATRVPGHLGPSVLVDADPFEPVETPVLWFTRGWPRWAGRLALVRSGASPAMWRNDLGRLVLRHRNDALVGRQSPIDASRAVIQPWRGLDPGLAGHAVCAALDIELRHHTKAKKSLSDVLRLLLEKTTPAKGFSGDDLLAAVEAVGGAEALDFLKRHTETVEPIPWDDVLGHAGLKFDWIKWRVADPSVRCVMSGGKVLIERLPRNSPLYVAGARVGDVVVAVNQRRVKTPPDIDRQIARMRPGQKLRMNVRRGDKQRSFRMSMGVSYDLDIPLEQGASTVSVGELQPGPARDAGLAKDDVLLKVDNMRIGRPRDLPLAVSRIKGGKTVLTIIRGGKRKRLKVTVPVRITWRGLLEIDPKAKPDARAVRDTLMST